MNTNETSAMTEASGLTQEDGIEQTSRREPLYSSSQRTANRWADRLREVTVKAPLQSLFVAFVLGMWMARRR